MALLERLPEYATVSLAMTEAEVPVAVSELHGGLCALLCTGASSAISGWLEECLSDCNPEDTAREQARDQLRELELKSWRSLNGAGLEFYPLLPDDDEALGERVSALALWCHGFLSGLGLAGFSLEESEHPAAEQLEEIVNDFSEISRAGLGADELGNENEADFALTELIEYVRVSVQIVFEELEPARVSYTGPATVH